MLGRFLSFSALLAWVIMPIWSFFRQLDLKLEDLKPHGRLRRFLALLGGALAAFTIYCFTPKDLTIARTCAADLANPEQIRPQINGFVREVLVKEGDHVAPGQKLAVLQNREAEFQDYRIQALVKNYDAAIQQAIGTDMPVDLRKARSMRADAEKQAEETAKDLTSLTLTTKTGGVVVSRDLDRLQGRQIKAGELFCEVDPMDTMQIKMALNEHQVRYVKKGQHVDMKFSAYPTAAFSGTIAEVHPVLLSKDLPPALSARRAGDVPTGIIDSKGQEVPLERTFEVRIDVANPSHLLRPGMAGHGAIHTGRYYRGQLVLQSLFDLISLDYRF
jgi:multidrug resistance efflux pump